MRSTSSSAAARPAAIWSWPGWPSTTPVIVVRLPSIQRIARKAKQPPAASSEPVLTPTNPWCPSNVLVVWTVPATGSVTLGVASVGHAERSCGGIHPGYNPVLRSGVPSRQDGGDVVRRRQQQCLQHLA